MAEIVPLVIRDASTCPAPMCAGISLSARTCVWSHVVQPAPRVRDRVKIPASTVSVQSHVVSPVFRALSPVLGSALTNDAVSFAMNHVIDSHVLCHVQRPCIVVTPALACVATNAQTNAASVTRQSQRLSLEEKMTPLPPSYSWKTADTYLNAL